MEDNRGKEVVYRPTKDGAWINYVGPFAALLLTAGVLYLCAYFILNPNIVTRICGLIMAGLYLAYVGRYYVMFFKSRKDMTISAVLGEDAIEHVTPRGSKRYALDDVVCTMSYSSATQMCILVMTEDDYTVLVCSTSNLFLKSGKEVLRPFYAINKYFMDMNPKHINYKKSRREKKNNPFQVPQFVFEVDFYSNKAAKFMAQIREAHRFR